VFLEIAKQYMRCDNCCKIPIALIDLAEFSVDEKGLVSSTINFRIKIPVDPLCRIGLPVTVLQTRNEISGGGHLRYEKSLP
jgi:hypothetical protein